jgi:hypothetical protein
MRNARFLVCFLCIPTLALAWDADILIVFKRSVVRRDPSSALASWGRGDYCSWNGIRCARDASSRWVDSISIASAGLEFSMWEGFGSFPRLRYINFSSNRITGAIPWSLGRLKSLVSLDLSFNGIMGSIPSSFNDLPLLEILVLRNNAMHGAFPSGLCGSTKLRVFDMAFNKLTGG